MSTLCIQIQPSRAPGIDLAFIRNAASQLGSTGLFTRYAEDEGLEEGGYLNLYFDVPSPAEAWAVIRATLYEDKNTGVFLKRSSIVVCQGKQGWDDYLLLHHFDPKQSLDQLGETDCHVDPERK